MRRSRRSTSAALSRNGGCRHRKKAAGRTRMALGWAVRARFAALALVSAAIGVSAAQAEDYPSRTIKIVVPTGPAGSYDVVARIVADQLSKRLGQGVAVENRSGAGTIVGTQSVIASPPDGYTLLTGG